jgi:hypothetical protein
VALEAVAGCDNAGEKLDCEGGGAKEEETTRSGEKTREVDSRSEEEKEGEKEREKRKERWRGEAVASPTDLFSLFFLSFASFASLRHLQEAAFHD